LTRRLITLALCLTLLFGCLAPASADIATLDRALSSWLEGVSCVKFSAAMQVKTLMPFEETTVAMLNRVLTHVTVDASVRVDGDSGETAAAIAVDGQTVMDWTERLQDGQYAFVTSLLPNRTLVSSAASPSESLFEADGETAAAQDDAGEDGLNRSDIAEAFTMPDAVTDMLAGYQAVTDGISEFATEKKASYNVKGIGKATWSRIARLTTEQGEALAPALRALISCGMDDVYRAEIAQMTFTAGFVVALYRDSDGRDLCVYLKGTVAYPDGTKRKLFWQWAFITDGLTRTDTFQYEVSKTGGTRDTRVIDATCTRESRTDAFGIDCETETTLKRYRTVDENVTTVALSGNRNADGALTCAGTVGRTLTQTVGEDADTTADAVTVDLLLTPDGDAYALTGTADVSTAKDDAVTSDLLWTFGGDAAQPAPTAAEATAAPAEGDVSVRILPTATPTDTPAPDVENGAQTSSLEQFAVEAAATAEPAQAETSAFLVGSTPAGLTVYTAPETETTVNLDGASADTLGDLLAEASQNLAAKLILAVAALPDEDAALLKDGMTDADFAAFTALLDMLDDH
jgi:hypothetical protein